MRKLVMLAILDGYGISEEVKGNCIKMAKKPVMDGLLKTCPNTLLSASGEAVGLPEGQMGNSEVGHMNIGAGRIVYQALTRVNIAVRNNTLAKMPAIDNAITSAIKKGTKVHIMGLASDGGVHSHINHILYLIDSCKARGVKDVIVHCFLDGRDVPPKSAATYLHMINKKALSLEGVKIGVVSGRYYAMDRDKNYDRLQLAYDALVYNKAPVKDLIGGLEESYRHNVTDEFVVPYLANKDTMISDGDSVIFANFRPDRAIEISLALTNPAATNLKEYKVFKDLNYVCMMLYSEEVLGHIAFPLQELNNIYGEVISNAGLKQLRIAETEKYAHVTYFFDGGTERDFPGADRILINSPKVATYDLQPEMSAYKITERVIPAILSQKYDTIILNFANCDMVGHTTVIPATVKAVEVVDECLGKIVSAVKEVGGILVVTADHGNADKLLDEAGRPFSAHSTNPVPFIVFNHPCKLRSGGNLGDIAPTLLGLLHIKQPSDMTGKRIII